MSSVGSFKADVFLSFFLLDFLGKSKLVWEQIDQNENESTKMSTKTKWGRTTEENIDEYNLTLKWVQNDQNEIKLTYVRIDQSTNWLYIDKSFEI